MNDVQQWLFETVGNQLVDEGGRGSGVPIKVSCCLPPPLQTLSSPIRAWTEHRQTVSNKLLYIRLKIEKMATSHQEWTKRKK